MNPILKNIKEQLHTLSMTDTERADIRLRLASHMHTYQPKKLNFILSPYMTGVWQKRLATVTAVFLMVMITSGSGLAYASNAALPGDKLYTVKVTTENVQAAVKTNPEDRANFEVKRVERRINEAVTLAAQGKLDEKKKESISVSIKRHTKRVAAETEKLVKENPDTAVELSAKLALSLEAHNEAITDAQGHQQVNGELDSIIAQVNEAKVEAQSEQALATEALVAVGENAISEADINAKKIRIEAEYAAAFPQETAIIETLTPETTSMATLDAQLPEGSTMAKMAIVISPKESIDMLRTEVETLLAAKDYTNAFLKLQTIEDLLMKIEIKTEVAKNIENVLGVTAVQTVPETETPAKQPAIEPAEIIVPAPEASETKPTEPVVPATTTITGQVTNSINLQIKR